MLFIIVSAAFWLWIVRNVLFWAGLWQVKEYRLDRLVTHLKETSQGNYLLFSPIGLLKWFLIAAYIPLALYDFPVWIYQFSVTLLYVYEAWNVVKELMRSFLRRPKFTPKAVFIVSMSLLVIMGLYTLPILEDFLWLLLLDRILSYIVAFFIFFLSFPTEIHQDMQVEKATKKLEDLRKNVKRKKPLLVIGVTGSYGKTSTKEYIRQVLKDSGKNIVYTHGSNNTLIGIANTILTSVKNNTDIFIVEMGAYKRGEIQQLCLMTKPTIGVLTAVGLQHASLFGSLENVRLAKYELIESLPAHGLALFNGNNEIVYDMYKKKKKEKVLYTTNPKIASKEGAGIFAKQVKIEKNGITFDVVSNGKTMHLHTALLGIHNVENILPAIYIAQHIGMTPARIKQAIASLQSPAKTMKKYEIPGDITVIEDTFNVNPQSVIAAMSYASLYKKKRFLVLQPMIELGKRAREEHYHVAKEAAKVCSYILLTNMNFYPQIQKGVKEAKTNCKIIIGDTQALVHTIQKEAKKDDIIIFEGRETAKVLNKLL